MSFKKSKTKMPPTQTLGRKTDLKWDITPIAQIDIKDDMSNS
jgi:hypothetical protein